MLSSEIYINDSAMDRISLIISNGNGRPAQNDRMFINALLYKLRFDCKWRDIPQQYGNHNSIFKRYSSLRKNGKMRSIFMILLEYECYHWIAKNDKSFLEMIWEESDFYHQIRKIRVINC